MTAACRQAQSITLTSYVQLYSRGILEITQSGQWDNNGSHLKKEIFWLTPAKNLLDFLHIHRLHPNSVPIKVLKRQAGQPKSKRIKLLTDMGWGSVLLPFFLFLGPSAFLWACYGLHGLARNLIPTCPSGMYIVHRPMSRGPPMGESSFFVVRNILIAITQSIIVYDDYKTNSLFFTQIFDHSKKA